MEKIKYHFEDFLAMVSDSDKNFVTKVHDRLMQENNKIKIVPKGRKVIQLTVTYSEQKTRRNMAKLLFSKGELSIHIYTKNYDKYLDVLSGLPKKMITQMEETNNCKNLTKQESNEKGCSWADCSGYGFYIGKTHYQKCRYDCFKFAVEDESMPFLHGIIESEIKARMVAEV